jgi:hypothetical protein
LRYIKSHFLVIETKKKKKEEEETEKETKTIKERKIKDK